MKKIMTSNELISYSRKYIELGMSYGKGMQCCITKEKLTSKANQYTNWYRNPLEKSFVNYGKKSGASNWEDYLKKFGKKYGGDCCGFIKGLEMGNRPNGANKKYDVTMDITISEMAKECTNVVSSVKDAKPGMLMWDNKYTHVAIYVGDNKCIESAPSCDGLAEHKWNYQGNNYWVAFGCLPWVDYGSPTKYEVYNCYWVNVRKGAGLLCKALTQLKCGTIVNVYETKNGWARIDEYEQKWVSMKCLKEK